MPQFFAGGYAARKSDPNQVRLIEDVDAFNQALLLRKIGGGSAWVNARGWQPCDAPKKEIDQPQTLED